MDQATGLQQATDPTFQQLSEEVVHEMERLHVPGVAIGVAHADAEYMAGFGVTNVDHPLPVDADTLFQIGSTTKTVTGTVAMRLVEAGKLDLDAPIRTYLPQLRLASEEAAAHVTLRHLFTHTGGWVGDYFDDLGNGDDALAKITERMADLPQLTPLGSIWTYNNSGFYLAGRVIEKVTGKPYETVVQELVFDPLDMKMSFFFAADAITYRVAAGHHSSFQQDEPNVQIAHPWALARTAHPAGGIISTVRDQLRYARFQMDDGEQGATTRLLTLETMALMQSPLVPAANGEFMGITWFVHETAGTRILRHGGATNGQMSAFVMVPSRHFAITVLTNANRGDELHQKITRRALELYMGISETPPTTLDLPTEQLVPYTGCYDSAMSMYELSLRDGGLIAQAKYKGGFPDKDSPAPTAPTAFRLAVCGEDQVIALDPPFQDVRGEFLRDPDGRIAWFRIGGRVHARQG
ncbi:MAG: beta-lactamase family protein [Chloroflexales bacterium]|nr:beta-lactamase family protein [Chloroflexales bacterium]